VQADPDGVQRGIEAADEIPAEGTPPPRTGALPPLRYRFAGFELDPNRLRLEQSGEDVPIDPKPLALITYLVLHRDRVVPRGELLEAIWPGVIVSDAALSSALRDARRALGDDGDRQRLLRTLRGEGIRFVGPVEEIVGTGAQGIEAFVGRGPTLSLLRAALRSADEGRGRVVLLLGEPGIGKTRTCLEFAAHARASGAKVLVAGCPEGEGAPPYWPWRVLVRAAQRDGALLPLMRLAPKRRDPLPRAIPELRGDGEDDSEASLDDADPRATRFLVADGLAELFAGLAGEQTLVVLLDDLHRADLASLQALERLTERAPEVRLLVVGTYRDTGVAPDSELAESLGRVARRTNASAELLPALAPGEVAQFVALAKESEPSPESVETLCVRSGGNPLFLKEVLSLWDPAVDPGAITIRLGGVREAVLAHLACLSPPCRELLGAASVFGRDFALAPLARVADTAPDECAALLEEARSARILLQGDDPAAYRFSHALVGETLYTAQPVAERIALHGRAGLALECLYGDESDRAPELAHHFTQAAPAGFAKEALHYSRSAAALATRRLSYEEAVRHGARALSLLPEAAAGAADRLGVLLELGDALARSGETEAARDRFREAFDLARRLQDWDSFGRAALGVALGEETGAPIPERVAALEEALEHVTERSLRARLLARLSYALWLGEPRERARALAYEAIECARATNDPETRYRVLNRAHWIFVGPGRLDARLAISKELTRLAERIGDRALVASSRVAPIWEALAAGEPHVFEREVAALQRDAETLPEPGVQWWAGVMRTAELFLHGQLDRAEQEAARALEAGRGSGGFLHEGTYMVQIDNLRVLQGRILDGEPLVRRAAEVAPEGAPIRHFLLFWQALRGNPGPAREELRLLAARDFSEIPDDLNWYNSAQLMVYICEVLGPPVAAEAGALYRLLLPVADECLVTTPGWLYMGSVQRYLGILAAICGEWDTSESHFEAGLERDRRMSSTSHCVAEGLAQYGRMLAARGDDHAARARLTDALALARSTGTRRVEEQARGLLERVS
jgi:DNA-binding winged helix-turn-helix (wHTH) protein/tetratricopeptide (TPR) repeat protein